MKKVQWLVSAKDYDTFYEHLWRTEFFKTKSKTDPWLRNLLKILMKMPHATAEQVHDIERLHFSTFWNIWIFHHHENDYIYDLGVLHELLHTVLFQKRRTHADTPTLWKQMPLATMEMAVSLRTEVFVYLRWPELRQFTFQKEIWADSQLDTPIIQIKKERTRLSNVLELGFPISNSEELRIAQYAEMNKTWNSAWEDDGIRIEAAWKSSYHDPSTTISTFETEWNRKIQHDIPFYSLAK